MTRGTPTPVGSPGITRRLNLRLTEAHWNTIQHESERLRYTDSHLVTQLLAMVAEKADPERPLVQQVRDALVEYVPTRRVARQ